MRESRWRMENQKLWLALGAAAAGSLGIFLARSRYEREQIATDYTLIRSEKIKKDCRAVFLSDLHDHEFGMNNSRLLAAVDHVNPDFILIGGDMMISKGGADLSVSLTLVEKLARRYPVYYGNGNHETRINREREIYGDLYDSYARRLREFGVILLENRTEYFREDLAITGIDLEERFYKKYRPDILTEGDIREKVGKADSERFQVLLCHSPLYFSACRQWGADLTLSGHYHGGTIRIPFLGGLMTPQFQFFLPWCAGEFEEDGKHMVVSRGLGTHSVNIRINNKPQVAVLDLKKRTAF